MTHLTQTISLPPTREAEWKKVLPKLISDLKPGFTELDCGDWTLGAHELQKIISSMQKAGLKLTRVSSCLPETIVTAAALGYQTNLALKGGAQSGDKKGFHNDINSAKETSKKLLFHSSTLRSGDHLMTEGDLLLHGDVNPGARISAGGDVMIWGRLRGTAHAGKNGNANAKIVALQLRPLQLRIGDLVARGPEEKPQQGFAEEAKILNNQIVIEPASTKLSSNAKIT